jgi:hypothetical protein
MKKLMNDKFSITFFFFCLLTVIFCTASSCEKEEKFGQATFLKGTWAYKNGAEGTYDGVSTFATVSKVFTNNVGYNLVIGEKCWTDIQPTSTTTCKLNQMMASPDGTRTNSPATFTKLNDTTVQANIMNFGIEILIKRP